MHLAKNYTPVEISKTKLQHDLFDNPPMLFQGELNWHSSRAPFSHTVPAHCAFGYLYEHGGIKIVTFQRPRSLHFFMDIAVPLCGTHYFGILPLPDKGERSLPCCPIKIHRACRDAGSSEFAATEKRSSLT